MHDQSLLQLVLKLKHLYIWVICCWCMVTMYFYYVARVLFGTAMSGGEKDLQGVCVQAVWFSTTVLGMSFNRMNFRFPVPQTHDSWVPTMKNWLTDVATFQSLLSWGNNSYTSHTLWRNNDTLNPCEIMVFSRMAILCWLKFTLVISCSSTETVKESSLIKGAFD